VFVHRGTLPCRLEWERDMAVFDTILRKNVLTGLAIGIGAVWLAPLVLPAAARAARPLAKAAIKGGFALYGRGREALAEVAEVAEDTYAEACAEMAEEGTAEPAEATPEPPAAGSAPA
jgi:hypothetical protein